MLFGQNGRTNKPKKTDKRWISTLISKSDVAFLKQKRYYYELFYYELFYIVEVIE